MPAFKPYLHNKQYSLQASLQLLLYPQDSVIFTASQYPGRSDRPLIKLKLLYVSPYASIKWD